MKILFIEQDKLDFLKANINSHLKNYSLPTNDWIIRACNGNPFREFKGDFPIFDLVRDLQNPQETDFQNVVVLYSSLRTITESMATDERLWAGLALGQFWNYTQYRWFSNGQFTVDTIRSHFYFGTGTKRSLTRNAIARLWWVARLSVDATRENEFEFTALLCEASSYIIDILERNTSNNPTIIHGFLEAILYIRSQGVTITRNIVRDLIIYLGLIGGIYILDCFSKTAIKEKIVQYAMRKYGK